MVKIQFMLHNNLFIFALNLILFGCFFSFRCILSCCCRFFCSLCNKMVESGRWVGYQRYMFRDRSGREEEGDRGLVGKLLVGR